MTENVNTEKQSCLVMERSSGYILFAEYTAKDLESELFNATGKCLCDIDQISKDTEKSPYFVALCDDDVVKRFQADEKFGVKTDSTGVKFFIA